MKNKTKFKLLLTTGIIGVYAGVFWSLIEFILYLVKDKPFNWDSIYTIAWCIVIVILFFILGTFSEAKEEQDNKRMDKFYPKKKSNFQERLDRMAKEKGYIHNYT